MHSKIEAPSDIIYASITCRKSISAEQRCIFKLNVVGNAKIMEPERNFPWTGRSSPISNHNDNYLGAIKQASLCLLDNKNLQNVVQCTGVPNFQPPKCLGSDTNQSGNTASLGLPCIPQPQKRSRRTLFLPPTLIGNTNDNQNVDQSPIQTDFIFESPGQKNNTSGQKTPLPKRRPLYLPLPRRMSCKFSRDPNPTNRLGRPMWNMSSRIDSQTRSVSSTFLSPARSVRSSSIPTKSIALEHSKLRSTPCERESVFDRLYREGGRQKNSIRVEMIEKSPTNYQDHRLLSTSQSFLNTIRPNLTYPMLKKPQLAAHSIVISPVHPPHPVGMPSSSLCRYRTEWRSASPLSQSRADSGVTTSVFYPTRMRRRCERETEKVLDSTLKIRQPSMCREDTRERENITANLCHFDHNEVMSESLNELIWQLIEEQSNTPTDVFTSENVVSWKSLIALLDEDAHIPTNITQIQELNDTLLSNHTSKELDHTESGMKNTEIVGHSIQPVYHFPSGEEFESAILFDRVCANAILREHDTDYSSSLNLTTVVEQISDSARHEVSTPLEAQKTSSSSPLKTNTDHTNMLFKGDRDDMDILAINSSPLRVAISVSKTSNSHEFVRDQDADSKANSLGLFDNRIMVANATLLRSCVEVVAPYGENDRMMDSTDLLLIPPLSDNSSAEQRSESEGEDSFINESLVSLSSASEYLHQESVEPLATKKALLDESVSGKENGEANKYLFDSLATNTGCFDQLSVNKPTHHRKMVEAVISVSQEVSHHDCCIEQVILNKSDFAYPATDPNFPWIGSASMTQNDERRRRVKRTSGSSSVLTVNVDLIASPEGENRGSSPSMRTNLSAPQGCYSVFKGISNFFDNIIAAFSSFIERESSKQGLLILPDYGPCKHQIAATRRLRNCFAEAFCLACYLLRRTTPEDTAREVAQFREVISKLNSQFRNAGITTKDVARELRQSFRGIILTIRSRLSSEKGIICRNSTKALGAALMQCVEQFVHIVDDRVMRYKWLEAWDRGCLLRLKADFIRYLYEAFPANLTYQLKCQEAYKCARLFFLENGLQDKAEWVYLQMNYATFLYMLGNRSTALFINERLINSLIVRRCGKAIKAKLQLNLQFYSKPW